ncbi:MAG TPA: cell surface protein SprA [Bacteroidales bacterium]|nr:cell surface protein SprA [Bacteroidales bacterium]
MNRKIKIILQIFLIGCFIFIGWISNATFYPLEYIASTPKSFINDDTIKDDTLNLPFPFNDKDEYPFNGNTNESPFYLKNPANVADSVYYDPISNSYIFTKKIGDYNLSPPNEMSFEEYQKFESNKSLKEYWKNKSDAYNTAKGSSLIPKIHIGGEAFDKIFGSNAIDIRPQGSAELIFGINAMRREDPSLDVKQRRNANFDFQEKIQMNVTAKIGDKIQLGMNYNTEATFEFENKMKLAYEGKEDEIIKIIEAGDVTLPLNSTLITGSQSLFGIKTKLQFGKTTVTSVFSQQKSKSSTIEVSGGAQISEFEVKADQYEENKHYFLSQYYRNKYNGALQSLPIVNSNINITKIEVWITNIGAATTDNRNVVALTDLGEYNPYNTNVITPGSIVNPSNYSNNLYSLTNNSSIRDINQASNYLGGTLNLVSGVDFEKVELAKKLLPTEFTYNSKLGFISLSSTLNADQVLAVAYQYTIVGDDSVYQVGDFSTDIAGPNALIVKLIKSTSLNTKVPLWNLMMKNVYALGAYQVNQEDFRLNIVYTNSENGVPVGYFSEGNSDVKGIPIIRILNLDNLNTQLDPSPDGVFDFIDMAATQGGTVQSSNGRIFFPVLEPFGKDLRNKFNDNTIADKYCYDSLYTMTKTGAQQYPDKNKFSIIGTYKSSSSSEISLNAMNVPQGSVKVTAGGIQLTENVDYTVDYTLGRVKVINEGILNSGTPIQINLESNSLFNIQTKSLMGTHIDHEVNKNFMLGATILNLTEKPITQKTNFGDEPISNTIWGLNGTYEKESVFITKLLDKLPFYSTKTPSKISITGEFAHLIPGHARAVGKTGTSYIDDFEGSKSSIDMKNISTWQLASTPQNQTNLFPEGALGTGLKFRFNAAKLCWYTIDHSVFRLNSNLLPSNITKDELSNHHVRIIYEDEIFPNKETPTGQPVILAMLDLAYYPKERGPYNYNTENINPANGEFLNPEKMWGGIMRKVETTDFEATNMEYIEFWLMDPFINPEGLGETLPNPPTGEIYFNLGDISEDVLRDSRKSFENGLPTTTTVTDVDTTVWGRVPTIQALTNSFDNNPDARKYQDVGYDGLMDEDERSYFDSVYIQKLPANLQAAAKTDPSSDNYHYFRGSDYDNESKSILERYKKYNGVDGNSPASTQSAEDYPTQSSTIPNTEDINKDNTLSESERYFQYRIELTPNKMVVGENYITDMYEAPAVLLSNDKKAKVKWYQFKIPIKTPDKVVGNIQDFKSIRFMRMFMKGWSENTVLRFASLELVRGEWRKYNLSLVPGEYEMDDNNNTTFDVSVVNIEENAEKIPVPYVIPPGIEREINLGTTNLQELNEQSLSLKVVHLMDGDARVCYKTCDFDMREFKTLRMFVHEEAVGTNDNIKEGDLTIFMRLGTDFTDNYYEYEIPLTPTPWYTTTSNPDIIWPDSNEFNITLNVLQNLKMERNIQMRVPGSGVTLSTPYTTSDNGRKVTVVGMPTLSSVKVIMIGLRNPKKSAGTINDDGMAKSAEVWVNELRLTDFNEKGGWAATSTVNATLADLGTATMAGKISTPGFGSIEKKISERSKETIKEYAIATSLELGKFLPEKTGIKIPMHFDYSHNVSDPQYNPLNPDLLFDEDIDTYASKEERDSVKALGQELTVRKSLNFVNVKKEKTGTSSKSHVYDVENLDFTYSYTEQYHRNIDIEHDFKKTYKGSIGYTFTNSPKNFTPLSKVKFFSAKPLKIVKDFNFYLMPKSLTFRTDLDRMYAENKLRNKSKADILIDTTYIKSFSWARDYGMKFDLTQNLKADITATADARIDEPDGRIDKEDSDYGWKTDSIMENMKNFGRITNYDQTLNVNYTIPINKISWFNWVTSSAKYTGIYSWQGAPLSSVNLGNIIENSNSKQLNGSFSFTNLYNKINYLKKLNQEKSSTTIVAKAKKSTDSTGVDSNKTNISKSIVDNILKFFMGIKTVSFTYSQGNGTYLPGFVNNPSILGMDNKWKSPGWGYVFGDINQIRERAMENNWISKDSMLNSQFASKLTDNFTARATIEPFSKFIIELTSTRTFSKNHSEYIKWDPVSSKYKEYSPIEKGAYSVSYLTWPTAFMNKEDKITHSNEVFEKFKENRLVIAWRLAENNKHWQANSLTMVDSISGDVYPLGYGPTSQDVLIPAFLSAYTNKEPEKVKLNAFSEKFSLRDIPIPNWRITYNGLSKLTFVKKYLKTLSISHAYKSTYTIGAYTSDILYADNNQDGLSDIKDKLSSNYVPQHEIAQVVLTEQFNPLLNIDMTWNNSLISNIELKRSRDLSLSFANNQLTEISSNEIVVGLGYRIKDVVLNVKGLNGGKSKKLKSDLNIKSDVSIKSNKTVLRKIVEDINQISTGQRIISISVSADYLINDKFTIKFFFDKIVTNPYVPSMFLNSSTNAGFSLKFTLAQ